MASRSAKMDLVVLVGNRWSMKHNKGTHANKAKKHNEKFM